MVIEGYGRYTPGPRSPNKLRVNLGRIWVLVMAGKLVTPINSTYNSFHRNG